MRLLMNVNWSAFIGRPIYPDSMISNGKSVFFMAGQGSDRVLGMVCPFMFVNGQPMRDPVGSAFEGAEQAVQVNQQHLMLKTCPLSPRNAAILRMVFPRLRPAPIGLQMSFGFGDRLGMATPGHVQAVRGLDLTPVFAQQSVKEISRTGRTPTQVLDDAIWGAFQAGWQENMAADADCIRTKEDADPWIEAGFSWYTLDLHDYVDQRAQPIRSQDLQARLDILPWPLLEDSLEGVESRYLHHSFDLGLFRLIYDRDTLYRTLIKYGNAVVQAMRMYRYLCLRLGEGRFDFEITIDQCDTPTTQAEHFFFVNELQRLGVRITCFSPRLVGRFERGVDYIGNLSTLSYELERHAAIMSFLGPYKFGLHSGSGKFSVFPALQQTFNQLLHIKTSGSSYLEALRLLAMCEPALFRDILRLCREEYASDRMDYPVSADVQLVPDPMRISDDRLPNLLDEMNTRQVLAVTFAFLSTAKDDTGQPIGERVSDVVRQHENLYNDLLSSYFKPHLFALTQTK